MSEALSRRTHAWLSDIQQQLRRRASVEKSLDLAVSREFLGWCDQQALDLSAYRRHRKLHFDRHLIARVQSLLEAQGLLPLGATTRDKTTAEQAAMSHQEDKAQREGPRAHRVLLNMAPAGTRPGVTGAEREMLDLDWRALDLTAFDVLLMIENLDSFYAATPDMRPLQGYHQPLLSYRGDALYASGCRTLGRAWQATGKPFQAMGDLDAKGLEIMLRCGADQLWLPPLEWLQAHATREHQSADQWNSQVFLRRYREGLAAAHPLQGYLALLLDEQRGLKQQWFTSPLVEVGGGQSGKL